MSYTSLIKGTLRPIILKMLLENGRMYGYEITKQIDQVSEGQIKLTLGAIYPTLHKLQRSGLLTSISKEVDNRLRKYYLLTAKGKEAALQEVAQYQVFADTMQKLILSSK